MWIILGDDDTIFILPNLLQTLENYNWREWHYIGARSESFEQNSKHSFNMAFGGGGIAISYPLAAVLATVLDSCIERYGYLFGSDDRIFACLTELGVQLTFEPGFHQIDMHGDISGLLGTLPLSPLISLHHFDKVNPIFPFLNRSDSIHHLFKSITKDPLRALQQSVCYNKNLTISISWGYSVSIFQGNVLLLNVLSTEKTFSAWKNTTESYMFDTRGNKSERAVFFFNNVFGGGIGNGGRIETSYKRYLRSDLPNGLRNLRLVRVGSSKLERINGKILRRHCCDVLTSSNEFLISIDIRECKDRELIAM